MDNYYKALKILDEALKDPYNRRDKLIIAKYLLEEALCKTNTGYEHKSVRLILERIDALL